MRLASGAGVPDATCRGDGLKKKPAGTGSGHATRRTSVDVEAPTMAPANLATRLGDEDATALCLEAPDVSGGEGTINDRTLMTEAPSPALSGAVSGSDDTLMPGGVSGTDETLMPGGPSGTDGTIVEASSSGKPDLPAPRRVAEPVAAPQSAGEKNRPGGAAERVESARKAGGDTQKLKGSAAPKAADRKLDGDPAPASDEHAALRGDDYGNWAEPTLKKKKAGDPMIGRMIAGRYKIVGLLGRGGMGAVYKARQPAVQRMIALKVLLKEFTDNETVIKRFHQEALAASRLTHPNTISVYDFGQSDDGILYMAMEMLRGEALADALRPGPLSPKRSVHIMRQVCKSLSEAHRNGIIHRDLKPDNIFLTDIQGERDFVKVLDFGVAKLKEYEGKEGTLTQAGMIFGTPKYMSPEQARSADLDARSDIYALGVILYELLMGAPPYTGENPLSILIAHVNETPKPFREFNPNVDVPPALEAVTLRAMAKEANDRPQTVDDLLEMLDACDEILEGASYDSVAARLPALVPGAGGGHSLAGPAIVPEGSDVLSPKKSGDTVVLDENGVPIPGIAGTAGIELTSELAVDRRRGGIGLWAALGLLIPVAGGGVWLFSAGGDETGRTASTEKPSIVATTATNTPDAAIAVSPADAAAAVIAKPAADAAPQMKAFALSTRPSGVTIIDAEGNKVGVAKPVALLRASKPTTWTLTKPGYFDYELTWDPVSDDEEMSVKLKPKAGRIKRPEPEKPKPPVAVRGSDSPPPSSPVASPTPPRPTPAKPVQPATRRPPRRDLSLQ